MIRNVFVLLLCINLSLAAQQPTSTQKNVVSKASWIEAPTNSFSDNNVIYFRKQFDIKELMDTFNVYYASINQIKLVVNGTMVSINASLDVLYSPYNQVNIAKYLKKGKNVIIAVIYNNSVNQSSPNSLIRSAFFMQALKPEQSFINTNKSWHYLVDDHIIPLASDAGFTHYCGVGEKVNLGEYPTAIFNLDYDDSAWTLAQEDEYFSYPILKKSLTVYPSNDFKVQRLASVRKVVGLSTVPPRYPSSPASILVPAKSEVKILFDQSFVTTAFPTLTLSAGKGATVKLKYAESLYVDDPLLHGAKAQKGKRSETDNKIFIGFNDEITTDGNPNQTWTSLSFRTFRYIQMTVVTLDEPLIINEFVAYATGFPYTQKASFKSDNADLQPILNVGWNTLKACSQQTYYGSPYYEEVTNLNAARVLSLAAIFNTADTRLTKKVLEQTLQAQNNDGYLDMHLPLFDNQVDISQSLSWLGMLIDLYQYSPDSVFIASMLPNARRINAFFQNQLQAGIKLPGCNFADYAKEWKNGVAPIDEDGASAFFQMYYLYIVRQYVALEKAFGNATLASDYEHIADKIEKSVRIKYWNASRGLFANESTQTTYSQQVNTLAILAGLQTDSLFMRKILIDKSLVQNSIYFKFYEHQALAKVGMANEYLNQLSVWQDQIKQGLTTWAEQIEPSRSDCFGWGVSPNIDFYRLILGVNASQPMFKSVRIEPHLATLKNVSGVVAHEKGNIKVNYQYIKKKDRWEFEINLPKGLNGEFIWNKKVFTLNNENTKLLYTNKEDKLVEFVE